MVRVALTKGDVMHDLVELFSLEALKGGHLNICIHQALPSDYYSPVSGN